MRVGERHRTAPPPSTTALHILATCDPPLLRPATCNAHQAPCCQLILVFECSRARSIIDHFKAFPLPPSSPKTFPLHDNQGEPGRCSWLGLFSSLKLKPSKIQRSSFCGALPSPSQPAIPRPTCAREPAPLRPEPARSCMRRTRSQPHLPGATDATRAVLTSRVLSAGAKQWRGAGGS